MTTLSLSDCLAEIATRHVPWAGDPEAGFDSGLYAVLDHANEGASALLYYRPEDHKFLLYVYSAEDHDATTAAVADAVANYLKRAGLVEGDPVDGDAPLPVVLHELERAEADKRLAAIELSLVPHYREVWPFTFH